VRRDGVRRLRVWFAAKHSGGAGAPPGTITSPCLEQADDLGVARPASGLFERDFVALSAFGLLERDVLTGKRGPASIKLRK
jgi:hypothetical protein